ALAPQRLEMAPELDRLLAVVPSEGAPPRAARQILRHAGTITESRRAAEAREPPRRIPSSGRTTCPIRAELGPNEGWPKNALGRFTSRAPRGPPHPRRHGAARTRCRSGGPGRRARRPAAERSFFVVVGPRVGDPRARRRARPRGGAHARRPHHRPPARRPVPP